MVAPPSIYEFRYSEKTDLCVRETAHQIEEYEKQRNRDERHQKISIHRVEHTPFFGIVQLKRRMVRVFHLVAIRIIRIRIVLRHMVLLTFLSLQSKPGFCILTGVVLPVGKRRNIKISVTIGLS